jgi:Subtilisin inhibitor-like
LVALVATVTLAACADGEAGSTVASPEGAPTSPATALTITVDLGDGSTAQEWTLTCDPPGGTHPEPEAACAAVADLDPTVLDPVPANQACTQIFGGPETATVRGPWNGEDLDASFARNNGCEITRWDAVAALFPAMGSTNSSPTSTP